MKPDCQEEQFWNVMEGRVETKVGEMWKTFIPMSHRGWEVLSLRVQVKVCVCLKDVDCSFK